MSEAAPESNGNGAADKFEAVYDEQLKVHLQEKADADDQKTTKELVERTQDDEGPIRCSIVGTGQNLTLIVQAEADPEQRIAIGQWAVRKNIADQVGFLRGMHMSGGELDMSGDEFCLDGTRAATSVLAELYKQPPDKSVRCSGSTQPVDCECRFDASGLQISARMATGKTMEQLVQELDVSALKQEMGMERISLVHMDGIAHFVCEMPDGYDLSQLKEHADYKKVADKWSHLTEEAPAIGTIFFQDEDRGFRIAPLIFVKKTNTFVAEQACGSGSCAVGIERSKQSDFWKKLHLVQPSGEIYQVQTQFGDTENGNDDGDLVTTGLTSSVDIKRQWKIRELSALLNALQA